MVGTAEDLGTVTRVDIQWEEDDDWYNPFTWFNSPTLVLDRLTVDTAGPNTFSTLVLLYIALFYDLRLNCKYVSIVSIPTYLKSLDL